MLRFYAIDKDTLKPYTENGYVPTFPYMFRRDNHWMLTRHPLGTPTRQITCPDTPEYERDDIVYVHPDRIQSLGTEDRLGPRRAFVPRGRIVRLKRS